jgi:hypothetical protein
VLARARREQIALLAGALDLDAAPPQVGSPNWRAGFGNLLSAPEQRALVRLTYEAFLRSVSRDPGPWPGYAAETARDWLDLLIRAQPDTPGVLAEARATRALALIRGLLLDLLATDNPERVTAAVHAGHWASESTRT